MNNTFSKKYFSFLLFLLSINNLIYAVPVTDLINNQPKNDETAAIINTDNLSTAQRLTRLENITENQSELLTQVNNLQQQVQDLRGQIEVLTNEKQQFHDQQLKFYSDLDNRVQGLEKAVTELEIKAAKVTSHHSTVKNKNDKEAYQAAVNIIQTKEYEKATKALKDFLLQYPNSTYVPNVHYWLGELYLINNNSQEASKEFNLLIKQYPKNIKVPDTLLKLALIDYKQGNKDSAIMQLKKIQKQYPNTPSAAAATAKLKEIQS